MALAFPFVLSQIIVDGLAYNVGMSKDCNENDGLVISRNNAAPTPSQPREFGCPEQHFKNSTADFTQCCSRGQVGCSIARPSPLLWKNQDDLFEKCDGSQTEVKALVGDVDHLVQLRALRAADAGFRLPSAARDHSPAVSFQCKLQALVYDILTSTTAVFSYVRGF